MRGVNERTPRERDAYGTVRRRATLEDGRRACVLCLDFLYLSMIIFVASVSSPTVSFAK